MTNLLQLLINALGRGAVYAVLALGVVLIFKATSVVSFAGGSLALVAGFAVYTLTGPLGWPAAAAAGVAAGALAGLLVQVLMARARRADRAGLAVLTLAVDLIISAEIVRRVGAGRAFLAAPFGTQPIYYGALTILRSQLVAVVGGTLLITLVLLAVRCSGWGLALRARSENRELAALAGVRGARVTAVAWLLAGALAGLAVLVVATQERSADGLGAGIHAFALLALPAAILGGLDSPAGAVVGGLAVGLIEAVAVRELSAEFAPSAVFLVVSLVLLARPSGVFGTREPARG